ncbi:MAG: ImmA/IrrE family metallo-endopeptidase [Candidatus Lokiarchaeota archaeon]|nr:ImmA/IrrE family metallo-endopeptidase [Candidatus Lokiarchaeota archaeon]
MIDEKLSNKQIAFCRQKARNILKEFENRQGEIQLPVPIDEIASFYGFEIYPLETIPNEQSAIIILDSDSKRKLIGINSNHHNNRQRFSIGHELGHFFLSHPSEKECDEDEIKLYNRQADEFSAELLIPLKLLKTSIKEIKDIGLLAKKFGVSEQAIWIKIKQQKLLNMILS